MSTSEHKQESMALDLDDLDELIEPEFGPLAEAQSAPAPEPEPAGQMGRVTQIGSDAVEVEREANRSGLGARPVPRISIQAFCEDQRTAEVIEAAAADRRLVKAHVAVKMGGVRAAVVAYSEAPTPNLVIVESTRDRETMLADLDRLAETCDEGTKVVVIGHLNDVVLYRELLRRGVSEYLVFPIRPLQLLETISNLYTDPDQEPIGHAYAFVGAKGGVGSSTVCHNVAWAISEQLEADVVIADLDLPFGTAGLDFNQDPVQGIADALMSPERVDEVLLDRLLTKCSEHLHLFAAPAALDRDYEIPTEAYDWVIEVLRQNVPYLAMDMPHVWNEWSRQLLLQADEIVITATPDLASLRNTKNLVDLLKEHRSNDYPPRLVLNQVGMPKRPEIPAKEFADAVGLPVEMVIDFDAETFGTAANNGQMIEEVAEKACAAQQFRELAMLITHKAQTSGAKRSLFAPILEKLKINKISNINKIKQSVGA